MTTEVTKPGAPPISDPLPSTPNVAVSLLGKGLGAIWIPTISSIVLLGLWEGAVRVFKVPRYMLPTPSAIARALVKYSDTLISNSVPTLQNILWGFALAVVFSLVLAPLMVYSRTLYRIAYPLVVLSQVVPKVALAPLFIIWFGFGNGSKIVMAFLISFFPIFIDALGGLKSVRPGSVLLFRSMGSSKFTEFFKLRLPHSLPQLFAGLKVGMAFAVVGAIVAEFVGADKGLGYVLVTARGTLNTELVFAAIAYLVVLGGILYLVVEAVEWLLLRQRKGGHA